MNNYGKYNANNNDNNNNNNNVERSIWTLPRKIIPRQRVHNILYGGRQDIIIIIIMLRYFCAFPISQMVEVNDDYLPIIIIFNPSDLFRVALFDRNNFFRITRDYHNKSRVTYTVLYAKARY